MQNTYPFVTILGVDGTGKTSTVKSVVETLQEKGIPSINFDQYRKNIDNPTQPLKKNLDKEHPNTQLLTHLFSTAYQGNVIAQLCKTSVVVKARYIEDVLAHHIHLGSTKEFVAFAREYPVYPSDLKVVLTTEESERISRVEYRAEVEQKINSQDMEPVVPNTRLYFMQNFYLKAAQQVSSEKKSLHIKNESLPLDEVTNIICTHLFENAQLRVGNGTV